MSAEGFDRTDQEWLVALHARAWKEVQDGTSDPATALENAAIALLRGLANDLASALANAARAPQSSEKPVPVRPTANPTSTYTRREG